MRFSREQINTISLNIGIIHHMNLSKVERAKARLICLRACALLWTIGG